MKSIEQLCSDFNQFIVSLLRDDYIIDQDGIIIVHEMMDFPEENLAVARIESIIDQCEEGSDPFFDVFDNVYGVFRDSVSYTLSSKLGENMELLSEYKDTLEWSDDEMSFFIAQINPDHSFCIEQLEDEGLITMPDIESYILDCYHIEEAPFAITNEQYIEDAYENLTTYQAHRLYDIGGYIDLEENQIILDEGDTLEDLEYQLEDDMILYLLSSQGYTLADLMNPNHPSKFIQSLRAELTHYDTVLSGYVLTFVLNDLDVSTYKQIKANIRGDGERPKSNRTIRLKAGSTIGLHNFIQGSTAGFNIVLDRDFIIPNQYLINAGLTGYSPEDVCGVIYSENKWELVDNIEPQDPIIHFDNIPITTQ